MKNAELETFRALIRAKCGMPSPPPRVIAKPQPGEPVEALEASEPPLSQPNLVVDPAPLAAVSETDTALAAAAAQFVAAPAPDLTLHVDTEDGEHAGMTCEEAWAPDTVVHRLVLLVMEMRNLSHPCLPPALPLQNRAIDDAPLVRAA